MHQEKRMRTLFLMSKGSASDIASLYPPVKTGGFIAPSSYPFSLNSLLAREQERTPITPLISRSL